MNYAELIQLIKEEKTCNEICTILGISNRQLYNSLIDLERQSLFYKREYYSDGSIIYKFISDDALLDFVKDFCNGTNIITPRGSAHFAAPSFALDFSQKWGVPKRWGLPALSIIQAKAFITRME